MIKYNSKSGALDVDGEDFVAYSGHSNGLNNPDAEGEIGVGPIPRGLYDVTQWYPQYKDKGPLVARLMPNGHNALGRTGLLCHGDNEFMNHTASDGCIVAGHPARSAWFDAWTNGDKQVMVE